MRQTLASIVLGICVQTLAIPFQNIGLNHNIDTQSMDIVSHTIGETNGILRIGKILGKPPARNHFNGITFDIYEDGELRFFFDDTDDTREPMDRIFINGKKMSQEIQERIDAGIAENNA